MVWVEAVSALLSRKSKGLTLWLGMLSREIANSGGVNSEVASIDNCCEISIR